LTKINRRDIAPDCACGCGRKVKKNRSGKYNKFLKGHNHGMTGKHHTKEWRINHSKRMQGENNPFYGKIHSEEFLKKITIRMTGENNPQKRKEARKRVSEQMMGHIVSESMKKIFSEQKKGDKNPNWQGGKSFEDYPREFNKKLKEMIRERDGYICQVCFKPQDELKKKLFIHHIDYDKKNCSEDNLISLCNPCHIRTNGDREVWQSIFASQ
jgi:hypothetical protein